MRRSHEDGFALVTALWAATILALVTASIIGMAQTEGRIAHNSVQLAVLDAANEGAIAMVQLHLLAPDGARQIPLDGMPFTVVSGGHDVTVTLQDQSGLIDINLAPPEDLDHLLQYVGGVDPDAARMLADRILDWREHGIGHRLNGAKADDYRSAGLAYGPREHPFASVAELKLVMGMTEALFERIEPALTVTSQTISTDSSVAPPLVLLALARGDDAAVSLRLQERREQHQRDAAESGFGLSATGRSIRITAQAGDTTGIAAHRTVVVRITGFGNAPFWTYSDT